MISIASSIRFRKADGLMDSFDNLQFNEEVFPGTFSMPYLHKVYDDDVITIQAKVTDGYKFQVLYSENCFGEWTKYDDSTLKTDGATYDYHEIDIDFADFAVDTVQFQLQILTGPGVLVEQWYSEPVEILSEDDPDLQQVEYFNIDNAFEVDYTTEISHLLRIEGQLKEYKAGGDVSVFDNQNEVTKIKDEVKRILTFKTEPIPRYLAEMLVVAVAHDKFFINEVEYVAEGKPEIDNSASNLVIFTVALTQRNVIGINTHDIGFDCDAINSDTMILQELAASGQKSFAITDDYMILTLTGYRTAGSPTIKAGTTPGGDDILLSMVLSASYVTEVALIPVDKSSISGGTLYVTISGAGATANIYIICIKNRQ